MTDRKPGSKGGLLPSSLGHSIKQRVRAIPEKRNPLPADLMWTFSFRFWEQKELLGLDRTNSRWFIALKDRLRDLSQKTVSSVIEDQTTAEAMRYHAINWTWRNMQFAKSDFAWVDKPYLDNPEYEFQQFHLSKAMGRVIGFWDEKWVFNIVALDPHHNMQLSKKTDYKPTKCDPLATPYEYICGRLTDLKMSKSRHCETETCPMGEKLASVLEDEAVIRSIPVADDVWRDIVDACEASGMTLEEFLKEAALNKMV